jgi:hypothetical protein
MATNRIWIVETGDPLPLPGRNVRLFRAGQIARRLATGDASVVWWSAAFDHSQKRYIANGDSEVDLSPSIAARLLWGRRYAANVSLARIVNHRQVADDRPRPGGSRWMCDLWNAGVEEGGSDAGDPLAVGLGCSRKGLVLPRMPIRCAVCWRSRPSTTA